MKAERKKDIHTETPTVNNKAERPTKRKEGRKATIHNGRHKIDKDGANTRKRNEIQDARHTDGTNDRTQERKTARRTERTHE